VCVTLSTFTLFFIVSTLHGHLLQLILRLFVRLIIKSGLWSLFVMSIPATSFAVFDPPTVAAMLSTTLLPCVSGIWIFYGLAESAEGEGGDAAAVVHAH